MPLPRTTLNPLNQSHVKHEDCWAKTTEKGLPGISVEQHCRTAGIIAGMLVAQRPRWLSDKLNMQSGVILAALHDVGKVSPGFQVKCTAWIKKHGLTVKEFLGAEPDHAKVGQKTIQDLLENDNLRFWAAIVGAHHGKLKGDWLSPLCDGGEVWASERRRLVEMLVQEFGPLPDETTGFDASELWLNAGLIAVADWLASDERTFPPTKILDAQAIRERATKQLDRIGFRPVVCESGKVFTDLFIFPPHELQKVVDQAVRCPGVYVVEASMGCGKTEAALMAAYNLISSGQATGLYFALPTQVTSNRIHERVKAFIDRITQNTGTRLIHSGSWLLEKEQPVSDSHNGEAGKEWTGRDWFASSRRALLAPFGVGTVDQALLGVVAAKHFFVRQFGLAGKVVILDEVHSYDLYTGTLLDELVRRLRDLGATVIILSATLTAARTRKLLGGEASVGTMDDQYPLLSTMVGGQIQQIPVQPDPIKTICLKFVAPADLPEAVLARAERGECVLWIRNTVQDAQEAYRQLCGQRREGGPEIGLMHARFPQFRREEVETEWLGRLGKEPAKRPTSGCVLVSTQVAEQSVDIDADLLVTDIAPTDMLLQRVGRLWRHSRPRPAGCVEPETWITLPTLDVDALHSATAGEIKVAFGKSAKVYAPYVLLRSFVLWRNRAQLTLSTDIRPLLEETYAEPLADEPSAWGELRAELEARKDKLRLAAIANSTLWQVALDDEEGVQTRWNSSPTVAVVVARRVVKFDSKKGASLELLDGDCRDVQADKFDFEVAKALSRNVVKVPRWTVKNQLSSTPAWIREYLHGECLLCELCEEKLMALPGKVDTGLTYRNDFGVVISPSWGDGIPKRSALEDDDESYDW